MRFVRLLSAAALTGALLSGGFAATANASPASCWLGNHRDLHLTVADNGRMFRVCRGAKVDVSLRAPDDAPLWAGITATGAVTVDRHHPQVFTPRGVTDGFFVAYRRGAGTVSSSRMACPPNPNGPTCHAMQGWKVSLIVR